jgi:hypothetical protein
MHFFLSIVVKIVDKLPFNICEKDVILYQYHFFDHDIRYDIISNLRPWYRYDIISPQKWYVRCLVYSTLPIIIGRGIWNRPRSTVDRKVFLPVQHSALVTFKKSSLCEDEQFWQIKKLFRTKYFFRFIRKIRTIKYTEMALIWNFSGPRARHGVHGRLIICHVGVHKNHFFATLSTAVQTCVLCNTNTVIGFIYI